MVDDVSLDNLDISALYLQCIPNFFLATYEPDVVINHARKIS